MFAKLDRFAPVIPLTEATLAMRICGHVAMIVREAADDRARELLVPLLVVVKSLRQLLQHSLQILRT